MCGLVTLFRRCGAPVAAAEVTAMRDSLTHRGPDDCGLFLDGSVGLGHRRLRIIDLEGGRQPMANGAGTTHIVFNGEIYNFLELRRDLESRGVRFRTRSDTETILALYDLHGERCVDHLRGMFAFVLWDSRSRRLIAVRDRMGIKPLYVLRRGSTVAFASEIKAFLHVPEYTPELHVEALPEYLVYRNLAGRATMYRDVERVEPGEMLVVTESSERRVRYWQPPVPVDESDSRRSAGEWADELEELLRSAVREHLISDVPVGTFNSGGLDSSLITALSTESARGRLNTYSVGFDDPAFDERPYAEDVARRLGTRHHSLVIDEARYAEWLPDAIWHHDEPLNHPHSVHIAMLSRLAKARVTVVLTGEGADELFAGYPRYRLARALDLFPWIVPLARTGAALAPARAATRFRAVVDGGGVSVDRLAAFADPETVARLLRGFETGPRRSREDADAPQRSWLARALVFDQETYLQSLLNRLDKMAMSAGLEGRVPFLDHRVVELAARIPPQLKIRRARTKYLLKLVGKRHLPKRIVDRQKAGFAVPIARWMRDGGVLSGYVDALLEPNASVRAHCDPSRLRALIEEHRAGTRDHGEILWGLINLELWQRRMLRKPKIDPIAIRLPGGGVEEAATA